MFAEVRVYGAQLTCSFCLENLYAIIGFKKPELEAREWEVWPRRTRRWFHSMWKRALATLVAQAAAAATAGFRNSCSTKLVRYNSLISLLFTCLNVNCCFCFICLEFGEKLLILIGGGLLRLEDREDAFCFDFLLLYS